METQEIRYKDKILGIIALFFPQAKVYLFGSHARGTQRRGSDIDIAIDNKNPLPIVELQTIREMIDALPTVHIDVVDFHAISPEFQQTILEEGKLWKS